MSERWGDSKQDREALDRHITRTDDDELDAILSGMLRWDPGTLSSRTVERILMDALADMWHDCFRRDDMLLGEMDPRTTVNQRNLFREKLMSAIRSATNVNMRVI